MSKNDFRSQFKATSVKKLKKSVDEDDAMMGGQSNEYLNLEDGKTIKIRIFPAHPGQDGFYVKRKCYWMSFPGNDGELHRGTVLDSVAHGGTKYDLVQEYIKAAKKKYGNDAAKMEALIGTGPKSNSLNPQYSWMCYADRVQDDQELRAKLWEFKKMVRDQLNKLTFSEDEDDAIEVDPFTDVDEGVPVLVKYLKNPNKKKGENYYDVSFPKKQTARPLTDSELEYFANLKPLSEVVPTYGMSDFERALEGLQNFDEENDFGLFDDEDWLEVVEKVKAQYDASDDEDDEPKKKTVKKVVKKAEPEDDDDQDDDDDEKPAKPAKKAEPEPEEDDSDEESEDEDDEDADDDDQFADMDRTALKKYIKAESLDITVKKSMSDDDIREAIREAVNAQPAEAEEDADDDDDDAEEAEEQPKAKVSLDDIRKKLKKG